MAAPRDYDSMRNVMRRAIRKTFAAKSKTTLEHSFTCFPLDLLTLNSIILLHLLARKSSRHNGGITSSSFLMLQPSCFHVKCPWLESMDTTSTSKPCNHATTQKQLCQTPWALEAHRLDDSGCSEKRKLSIPASAQAMLQVQKHSLRRSADKATHNRNGQAFKTVAAS